HRVVGFGLRLGRLAWRRSPEGCAGTPIAGEVRGPSHFAGHVSCSRCCSPGRFQPVVRYCCCCRVRVLPSAPTPSLGSLSGGGSGGTRAALPASEDDASGDL